MQGVSKTDFENYVKANDAILKNMQNQGQGYLLSNSVTNPKEDLKGITTRSGVVYQGPTIPTTSSPKVVERRTKVTKDTVFPTNNGITEDVQPPVVPVENQNLVFEPVVAPVSAPMPNPKPSIPYPSRRNDEKRRENANEQKEKFYEIFKDMSFEISFVDALTLMPKFASTLKALILPEDVVNITLGSFLSCNSSIHPSLIFPATILQSFSATLHISNIDYMYIKSYSFRLFSSLPGVLTPVRGESLKLLNGFDVSLPVSHLLWSSQSFGHQKAINGIRDADTCTICSGLVNPLAPRKGKFHGGLIAISTLCT
ncbi:hypothetical protein Tco_0734813 [Tanacetum coccineum]